MKGPGIAWMIQTAIGFSLAGPMFVVGLEFLRAGRIVLGVLFFSLGLIVVFAPSYFVRRIGGPGDWVRRRVKRTSTPSVPNPLDRFRRE